MLDSTGFKLFELFLDKKLTAAKLAAAHKREQKIAQKTGQSHPNPYHYLWIREDLRDVYTPLLNIDIKVNPELTEMKIEGWLRKWHRDSDQHLRVDERAQTKTIKDRSGCR